MFQELSRAVVESFSKNPDAPTNPSVSRDVYSGFLAAIVAFLIAFVLVAMVGKYLWNEVIVSLIAIARPARSVWQMLGLFIFLAIFKF